jgi:hypothetical protein
MTPITDRFVASHSGAEIPPILFDTMRAMERDAIETESLLRDLVTAIEKKADIGKFRQKTVSPLMEEVIARAKVVLEME